MPKKKENIYPELSKFDQPSLKVSTINYNNSCEICFRAVSQNKVHEVLKCKFCNVVAHVACLKEYKLLPVEIEEVPKEWTCHYCVDTINYEVSYRKTLEQKKELEKLQIASQIMISKHWRKIQAWKEFQKVRNGTKQFQKVFIVALRKKQFSHKKQQQFRPIKLIINNITDLYMIDRDPKRVGTSASNSQLPSLHSSGHHSHKNAGIEHRDLPIYVLIHVFDLSSGTFVQAWRNETAIKILSPDPNNLYPSVMINEDFILGGVTGFHHIVLSLFQKGHNSGRDFFIGQCYLELSQNMNWRKGGKFQLSLQDCSYSLKDNTGMEIKCDTRGEKPQGTISLELITSHGMTTVSCSAQATSPEEFLRALSKYPVETLPGYILIHRSSASNSTSLTISTSAAAAAAGVLAANQAGKKKEKGLPGFNGTTGKPSSPKRSPVRTLSPLISSNNSIQSSQSNPSSPINRKLLPSLLPPPIAIDLSSHSADDADDHGSVNLSVISGISDASSIKTMKTVKSMTSMSSANHSPLGSSSPNSPSLGGGVAKLAFKLSMKKVWIVIFSEKIYIFNHYGDQLKLILDLKFLHISYELNLKNKIKIIYNITCPQISRIPPFQFCAYYDHDAILLKATMISSLMLSKKLIHFMETLEGGGGGGGLDGDGNDFDSSEEHSIFNDTNHHRSPSSSASSITRQSVMMNNNSAGSLPNVRQSILLTKKATLSNLFMMQQQQDDEERAASPGNGTGSRHPSTISPININSSINGSQSSATNKKRFSSHPYINHFFDLKQFVSQWKQLDMLLYPNKFRNSRQQTPGSFSRQASSSNFSKSTSFSFPAASSPSHHQHAASIAAASVAASSAFTPSPKQGQALPKLKTGSVSFSLPMNEEEFEGEREEGDDDELGDLGRNDHEHAAIQQLAKAVSKHPNLAMMTMNMMVSPEMKTNSLDDHDDGNDHREEDLLDADEFLEHSLKRSVSFKPFSANTPIIK